MKHKILSVEILSSRLASLRQLLQPVFQGRAAIGVVAQKADWTEALQGLNGAELLQLFSRVHPQLAFLAAASAQVSRDETSVAQRKARNSIFGLLSEPGRSLKALQEALTGLGAIQPEAAAAADAGAIAIPDSAEALDDLIVDSSGRKILRSELNQWYALLRRCKLNSYLPGWLTLNDRGQITRIHLPGVTLSEAFKKSLGAGFKALGAFETAPPPRLPEPGSLGWRTEWDKSFCSNDGKTRVWVHKQSFERIIYENVTEDDLFRGAQYEKPGKYEINRHNVEFSDICICREGWPRGIELRYDSHVNESPFGPDDQTVLGIPLSLSFQEWEKLEKDPENIQKVCRDWSRFDVDLRSEITN
jgi:hypothetical protein